MTGPSRFERSISVVGLIAVLWGLGLLTALGAGWIPNSARGWVLFVMLAPPATFLVEFLVHSVTGQFDDPLATRRQYVLRGVIIGALVLAGLIVAFLVAS